MADSSVSDWDNLPDDSKWIFEALARLGFGEFGALTTSEQSLVVALAQRLKHAQSADEVWES